MYNLGEHFNMNLDRSKSNNKCIFKGEKYRITVLSERLVRLEH